MVFEVVYLNFPTKARYVFAFRSMHATVSPISSSFPNGPQNFTIKFSKHSPQTATSQDITAVWQYSVQQGACQRLHHAAFIAGLQTVSIALVHAVCCNRTVRSFTTKLKITVGECLLPFCPVLLFVKNTNITTCRSVTRFYSLRLLHVVSFRKTLRRTSSLGANIQ
jgi:hypothetical protein